MGAFELNHLTIIVLAVATMFALAEISSRIIIRAINGPSQSA